MKLQSIIIPEYSSDEYLRGAKIKDSVIVLNAGECFTTDTYYNSFCYSKYRHYTQVESVSLDLDLRGEAEVRLMCFDGENDYCIIKGDGKTPLFAELCKLPQNGILYFEVTAIGECTISGGSYSSDCTADNIDVCIAICTYKRENYVLRNIKQLNLYRPQYINRVFVLDNGNTLNTNLSDDFIWILPNRNLGGSGGFTRGLIEAKRNGFSHIILMDDDVEFHSETLSQMTTFVSLLKDDYKDSWISAGMIPLDKPWTQYELGADWDGNEAIVHKHDVDIRNRLAIIDNLDNPNVGYAGWWTLLMPVSVTENGLPYPMFIKFDDVEYGMRNSQAVEIITMNGISVRHEAFDLKKNFILDYYNLRNRLIVNALYDKYNAVAAVKRFLREIFRNLIQYRYDNIPIILRAANDFLHAADIMLNSDEERLNMELIEAAPKLIPLSDIEEWSDSMRCDDHITDKRITPLMLFTLGGHLIPSFALKKEITAVPLARTGTVDCFGKRTVIQYQLGSEYGIKFSRSFGKFVKYSVLSMGVAISLMFGYGKSRKQIIEHKNTLISFEFWEKHLELDK